MGIKRYGADALEALIGDLQQPRYRSDQLVHWLYGRPLQPPLLDYQQMANLPSALRSALAEREPLAAPTLLKRQASTDGSRKYLLGLADGERVECVGIPDNGRLTVCFSTQVGCAMGCVFCATGHLGLTRSLAPGEMLDQLLVVAADFQTRVSNAVAMGEGEPFANYDNTLAALRLMNDKRAMGIAARRLTVSSCGLIPAIRRFTNEPEQFTLAVSLHSAIQSSRDQLMPKLAQQSLDKLHRALTVYQKHSGRRVSLEYTLIDSINDTPEEIEALCTFCHGLKVHVNLIALNLGQTAELQASSPARAEAVRRQLEASGIETTLRRSRGSDIAGACGQLAARRG